jgi:transitional endoplasmic reticulum ATPase
MTTETKGKTLDQAGQAKKGVRDVVDVVRHGQQLVIPETLTLERAKAAIEARIEYESQDIAIHAPIAAPFPFEGAYAMFEVLTEKFGWANGVPTPGFFGPQPPAMLSVPVDVNKVVQVPWGRFALPNIEGYLQSSIEEDDLGVTRFVISGKVKRLYEKAINEIVEAVKDRVRHNSIYKGKAFRVRLFDDRGNRLEMPEPRFLDLSQRVEPQLILPEDTDASVRTNIFTPIEQTARVVKHGIPLKRGVLLAGQFGTGKTMIARATAEKAVDHRWTYVEVDKVVEFAEVARMVAPYGDLDGGVVLFCEDIDRVMRGDDRSIGIDEILNVIDGVDSKGSSMMVVLTTNELERITAAMLRPGRLDAIIHVGPPDKDAAIRLARQYGHGLIDPADPLIQSGEALAGKIPAVIREIVERSKLDAMRRTPNDEDLTVTDAALAWTAQDMSGHVELLTPAEPDKRSETVKAAEILAEAARETGGFVLPFPVRPSGLSIEGLNPETLSHDLPHPESQARSGKTGRRAVVVADEADRSN